MTPGQVREMVWAALVQNRAGADPTPPGNGGLRVGCRPGVEFRTA